MGLITAGITCEPCVYYLEISKTQGKCLKRNKNYWVGAKIPCEDLEVEDFGDKNQEDEHLCEDSQEGE